LGEAFSMLLSGRLWNLSFGCRNTMFLELRLVIEIITIVRHIIQAKCGGRNKARV
jgi:hypothetical protein